MAPTDMLGLTTLGTFHTAIAFIALGITLAVLGIAAVAGYMRLLGQLSPYVESGGRRRGAEPLLQAAPL